MTCSDSSPSRTSFLNSGTAALCLLLCACSTSEYDSEGETHRAKNPGISNRFEWAVQHFEAGDYEKAVRDFEKIRTEGAAVPEFDLLPYYLGMSHSRLGHLAPAAQELETFVRSGAKAGRAENQDARLGLLLVYEKLARWKDASTLAAETDKLTLFQYNRALVKLIWARALREQSELAGARTVLDEVPPYLDKVATDSRGEPLVADPDLDLWGRFHFTGILIQEMECNRHGPRDLNEGKTVMVSTGKEEEGAKKKRVKASPHRLYAPWMEATTDCFRQSLHHASEDLFARDSIWSTAAEESLTQGVSVFAGKIQSFLKAEGSQLERHRQLQKSAREQLYRLMGTLDEDLKNFKNRSLNPKPLESLRKLIDRLLVQISSPS